MVLCPSLYTIYNVNVGQVFLQVHGKMVYVLSECTSSDILFCCCFIQRFEIQQCNVTAEIKWCIIWSKFFWSVWRRKSCSYKKNNCVEGASRFEWWTFNPLHKKRSYKIIIFVSELSFQANNGSSLLNLCYTCILVAKYYTTIQHCSPNTVRQNLFLLLL